MAWGSSREWLKFLEPFNHVQNPKKANGSSLWTSSDLAMADIWGVNQWMEYLSLCVCVCMILSSK